MANFIQFRRSRRSSTSSVYMQLLSSLATDLDNMLSELCTTPPPPYDRLSDSDLHTSFTTMNKFIFVALVNIAVASCYEIVQDNEGQNFYLVPLQRQRRQATNVHTQTTSVDISKGAGDGVRATLNHQGTIFNNGVNRLDGGGSVSKQFRPSGPVTLGGQLGYSHVPSGSGVNVNAQHTPRFGTDLGVSGNANLWSHRNSRLEAVGSYNRHYGGPWGTGRPDYYGGVQFTHRF